MDSQRNKSVSIKLKAKRRKEGGRVDGSHGRKEIKSTRDTLEEKEYKHLLLVQGKKGRR